MREIINNANIPREKVELIYNSIKKKEIFEGIKRKQVLTVGELNEETYLRKGVDRFIEVAKNFPEVPFIHIGKWTSTNYRYSDKIFRKLKEKSPENVHFLGFVEESILVKYLTESKIYLQLSRHEAFGISVVEAMNYGCIPIVSNSFALPEIVNNKQYVSSSTEDALEKIKKYMNQKETFNFDADRFSNDKREKKFFKLFTSGGFNKT